MQKTIKCLLIGFYNRNNLGDDVYQIIIPKLLPECIIECVSCDDIEKINDDIDIVLVGGGDLVNEYFMKKIQCLLKGFTKRVYGISIGIPFPSCCHYLNMFDHVVVRSRADLKLVSDEIGEKNVSYLPDFSVSLFNDKRLLYANAIKNSNVLNVGLCLAQPLFYNNPKKSILIQHLCEALKMFSDASPKEVCFNLLAFNTYDNNTQECDIIINNIVAKKLQNMNCKVVIKHDIKNPDEMLLYFKNTLDITLCMRFHSVMFSLITNTPFVPLYVSQKINNVLQDFDYDMNIACKLPFDSKYRPTHINIEKLFNSLMYITDKNNVSSLYKFVDCGEATQQIHDKLHELVITQQPYATRISHITAYTFIEVLNRCKTALCKYLDIEPFNYETILHRVGPLTHERRTSLEIARFLCFIITSQINHVCVWGLAENLRTSTFKLYDAIKYIYDEINTTYKKRGIVYFPSINNFNRRTSIKVDFVFSNDFTMYHRSGWSYVVGGLMNLDASLMLKESDVFVDTYVDRTFHWGRDIMKTLGEIPYTKPWYGFIHHTFDTTHSENNCKTLLEQEDFIVSLQTCRGLIVLTQYLKTQLEQALKCKGFADVPVHVLYHPMEFVDNDFTMDKFKANNNKKIVQIGAWLRNPYAIYQMELPRNKDYDIIKTHLKGTEMDLYFAPPDFIENITMALYENEHPIVNCISCMCRTSSIISRNVSLYPVNKYSQGVIELLTFNHNSVSILEKLSNVEYDNLLAENIVFLNLVDCSAVNTVIECVVRNTPLIVNRHPALEELLGKEYPGFYNTLLEASMMCVSLVAIEKINSYLQTLDKSRYKLQNFISDFQDIITNGKTETVYINRQTTTVNLPVRILSNLSRFLPPRFRRFLINN